MRRFISLLLICYFGQWCMAQDLPSSYAKLTTYIQSNSIDSIAVEQIDAHLRTMASSGRDSLRSHVFPALEEVYAKKGWKKRAFLNAVLTVSAYQILGDIQQTQRYIDREIALRQANGIDFQLMMAYSRKMFILADVDSNRQAMSTALALRDQMSQTRLLPGQKGVLLQVLCIFFNQIGEKEYALQFCNEAYAYKLEHQLSGRGPVLETLALLWESQNGGEQKSVEFRRKALEAMGEEQDSFSMRISYRNMARHFMRENRVDSVSWYFERTFELYKRYPYFNGWFMDQVEYARFLIDQDKSHQAKVIMDTLGSFKEAELTRANLIGLYKLRESYAVKEGDFEQFKDWSNQLDSLFFEQYSADSKAQLSELKVQYETEKKEAENVMLKQKNKASRIQLIVVLIVLGLVLLVVVLIVQRRARDKKIHQQKQELLKVNLEKSELVQKQLKIRNTDLLRDIQNYVKQVVEQQSINEELLELINDLRKAEGSPIVQKKTAQMKVRLNDQIAREAFREVLDRMKEVYPVFYEYLKNQVGADKESELLVTAMYFLGYETKNIASVLNRTEKAVRSIRYRVRKKLNMSDSDDFIQFLKAEQGRLSEGVVG